MKVPKKDNLDRLCGVVVNSLDNTRTTNDLARQAYQSRTQFHRLFRRRLGVRVEGFGDPMEYEESVAPWSQATTK